jgi:hypothetical protein
MNKLLESPVVKRVFRTVVSVGVPAAIQLVTDSTNPLIMLIVAPALNGLGKWLRDKYQLPNVPI